MTPVDLLDRIDPRAIHQDIEIREQGLHDVSHARFAGDRHAVDWCTVSTSRRDIPTRLASRTVDAEGCDISECLQDSP